MSAWKHEGSIGSMGMLGLTGALVAAAMGYLLATRNGRSKMKELLQQLDELDTIAKSCRGKKDIAIVQAKATVIVGRALIELVEHEKKVGARNDAARRENLLEDDRSIKAYEAQTELQRATDAEILRLLRKLAGEPEPTPSEPIVEPDNGERGST